MIMDPNFIVKVLLSLIVAAALAFAVTPLVKRLAQRVGAMDVPKDERRMHKIPIPRMGGLAIFFAFLIAVLPPILSTAPACPPRGTIPPPGMWPSWPPSSFAIPLISITAPFGWMRSSTRTAG